MTFDLCFKCDDDVQFLQKGWDSLYWETIQRTGYEHLIFYDKNWLSQTNLSRPIKFGKLVSNCPPEKIQGVFYTVTKNVIDKVGYFDEQQFGNSELKHVDFSFRCCRAGFNILANPFDVENSNDFLKLQIANTYSITLSSKYESLFNPLEPIINKKELLKMDRLYIPYNENFQYYNVEKYESKPVLKNTVRKKQSLITYKKADATYYPDRGLSGFIGFLVKRLYNLSIELRIYFIPRSIIYFGKIINKISIHLLNIRD
jgi:hypothetical protein